MRYYECMFANRQPKDAVIVIEADKELDTKDAARILNEYYKQNPDGYTRTTAKLPELQDFTGLIPIGAICSKADATIVITTADQTPCAVLVSTNLNRRVSGPSKIMLLSIPRHQIGARMLTKWFREIAEEWAYQNKMAYCSWCDFMDGVTDEFLEGYGLRRLSEIPERIDAHVTLDDKNLVLPQATTVIIRDSEKRVIAGYNVEMPNSILTEEEMLVHFAKIAEHTASPNGACMTLNELLHKIADNGRNGTVEKYSTRVEEFETEASFTVSSNTKLPKLCKPE